MNGMQALWQIQSERLERARSNIKSQGNGRDLYDRLRTMGEHLSKVGRAIESAGNAYNDTVASFEKRVLVSARKFGDLQEVAVELPEASPALLHVRQITAPDVDTDEAPS